MLLYVSIAGDSGNIICSRDIRIDYIGGYSTPVRILQTLLRIVMCLLDYLAGMLVPPVARASWPSCLVALMRQQHLVLCLILDAWFPLGQVHSFCQRSRFLTPSHPPGKRLFICGHHSSIVYIC